MIQIYFTWLVFICILLFIYLSILTPRGSFQSEPTLPRLHTSGRDIPPLKKPSKLNPHDPAGVLSSAAHNGDRILEQLNLKIPHPRKILEIKVYPEVPHDTLDGGKQFIKDQCNVKSCRLSSLTEAGGGDVVLWRDVIDDDFVDWDAASSQLWGISMLESPMSMRLMSRNLTKVNFTVTYRSDSTIVTPYERFVTFANTTRLPRRSKVDYAAGKSKLVAAFVSNCYSSNKRAKYIKELQQHIDVHVYGFCGNYTCSRYDREGCLKMLKKDYKFYLAFENANCRDYITEKLYWNALW